MSDQASGAIVPWHKKMLYGLTNWGLFTAGAVNLAIGTYSAMVSQVALAGTSLTAGLILLFAATIDRFESLKGLGVEAKTRQLDQKIEQADTALRKVKELTELIVAPLIAMNSKMGRWDSAPTPREAYALAQKVRAIMTSLGSDPSAMRDVLRPWITSTCIDLGFAILAPLTQAIQAKKQVISSQISAIPQPHRPDDAELLSLIGQIKTADNFINDRLHKISEFSPEDYPDRFIQLIEATPLVDTVIIEQIKAKALLFAPSMRDMREKLQMENPEPVFSEIDSARTA